MTFHNCQADHELKQTVFSQSVLKALVIVMSVPVLH